MWAGEMPAHSDHASHMSPLTFPATPLATFVAAMVAPQGPECQVLPAAGVEVRKSVYPHIVGSRVRIGSGVCVFPLSSMFD